MRSADKTLENKQRLLIQLPTGTGKTRTAIELVIRLWNAPARAKYLVLWLAHSAELLEQSFSTFVKVWHEKGSCSLKSVRQYGQFKSLPTKYSPQLILATYQKLTSAFRNKTEWFEFLKENKLIIICDEAHKSAASRYREAIVGLLGESCLLIGLTATPGRSSVDSHENAILSNFYRGTKIVPNLGSDPILELQKQGVLAQIEYVVTETHVDLENYLMDSDNDDISPGALRGIGRIRLRNERICEVIEREVLKKKKLIVFACSIEHAKQLAVMLGMKGVPARYIDHTFTWRERQNVILDFQNSVVSVLLNYEILSTGFDAPNLDAVVLARPTMSPILYSQMIGRVLRGPRVGGTSKGYVYDFVDNLKQHHGIMNVHQQFESYWR